MSKKKIALFGGTFNPPHFGHLNLAISIKEAKGLDEVIFLPAFMSPFKQETPPISPSERLTFLNLMLDGIEGFTVETYELSIEGPSYTVDTVRALRRRWGDVELFLLLGEDQLHDLHRWKEVDALFEMAAPLVGTRRGQTVNVDILPLSDKVKSLLKSGLVDTPLFEISSTEIRKRLKEGLYCGHLLPASLLDRIQQNHLYYYP